MRHDPSPLRWSAATRARLAAALERREGGFVLEGRKAVGDALERSQVTIREVWVADDLDPADAEALVRAATARGAAVGRARALDLARVSDTVTPQGVLARADDPAWDADDLVRGARGPLVLLDRVQDPGNVGAVFRVAAAFGASGVLVSEGTADPLGPKALRASAGTAVGLPFARGTIPSLLRAVAEAGLEVWLLDGRGEALWDRTDRPAGLVLAVGSEGRGASQEVARAARVRVAIPISPAVESLNAAVAVGIAAAHLFRLPPARRPVPGVRPAGAPPRGAGRRR